MFQGKFYNVSRKFQGKLKNKISSKFKALQITKGRRAEVMEFIPYKSISYLCYILKHPKLILMVG